VQVEGVAGNDAERELDERDGTPSSTESMLATRTTAARTAAS